MKDEVCEMKVKGARGREKRAKQAGAADWDMLPHTTVGPPDTSDPAAREKQCIAC